MGIGTLVALVANGASVGAALTATYGVAGSLAIRFAAGAILSTAANALASRGQGQPQQQQLKRDLAFPTSRPPKRVVYGRDRVLGTPVPWPVVGEFMYCAWIVSSRPSEGPFTIYLDNREVELGGADPYDFQGNGALGTNSPFANHVRVWIQRGDQTQPPQTFLDEAGFTPGGDEKRWRATDAAQGCTIVYARLRAGGNERRQERWPSVIPRLEIEGNFTRVWDPRDGAQDANDESTWQWSEDPYLAALDVLRRNPFRPYDDANLVLDQFSDAADIADEVVSLKSGGSERRYAISGVVAYNGQELEQIMQPVLAAGGARLTRSGGRLGIIPAAPRTSAVTITDALEGLAFSRYRPDQEIVNEVRVVYSPRARGYEPAELTPYAIPGALAQDGGQPSVQTLDLSMVSSDTQAQRLRKIFGARARQQTTASFVAPPETMEAVSGSVVTLDLPSPYGDQLDGLYEIESMHPALDPVGEQGFAMRCPVQLRSYSDTIYDWDPATDEEDVFHPPYDGTRTGVAVPGAISVTTGEGIDIDNGQTITPRFRYEFQPSPSTGVDRYETQARLQGDEWAQAGFVSTDTVDGDGDVFGFLEALSPNELHDIRVRALAPDGASEWVEILGVSLGFDITVNTAQPGPGRAEFNVTAPATNVFRGVRIYRTDAGDADFGNAVLVAGIQDLPAGQTSDVAAGDTVAENLLLNGDFDDASVWNPNADWTIANGVATKTPGDGSRLDQNLTDPGGVRFRYRINRVSGTAGTVQFIVEGDTTQGDIVFSTNAVHVGDFQAAPTNITQVGVFGSADFDGSIDDLLFFEELDGMLGQGEFNFWVVPVTQTLSEGAPQGPFPLIIP
ncbi:MAG: phage tail protein [Pseudomonadota bacterium]